MSYKLVYYSQQDPQWKNEILGFGEAGDSIGYVGCALTSMAMLLSGHGYAETPHSLNQKLKSVNGFASAAIIWGVVSHIYPKVILKAFIPCATSAAPLDQIDASISAGQPALVQVDSSPAAGIQTHWVVLYARKGNDYLMLDPWPYPTDAGKETPLMPRYSQGRDLQRAISHVILYENLAADGIIATATSAPVPATTGGPYARVKADVVWGLNMRSSIDTSSAANIVTVVHAGSLLTLIEADGPSKVGAVNQWVRVRDDKGHEGYAAAWYLEKVQAAEPAPVTESTPAPATEATTPTSTPVVETTKMVVIVKSLWGAKLFKIDSAKSQVVSTERYGAKLKVVEAADKAAAKIGVAGQWINVKGTNNQRGFVDAKLVKKG